MNPKVIFLVWLAVSLIFKVTSRISFLLGLTAIMFSVFSALLEFQGYALRFIIYALGFFIAGFISYFKEVRQSENK